MNIICWICIGLNIIAGIVCIISEVNKNQDAAGKKMMSMIGTILLLFAGFAALFLYLEVPYISLIILIAPTFIVCRQVLIIIKESA